MEELGSILGLRAGRTAILLGAGNLGRALLNNFDFSASGFKLLCAFDANPELKGKAFGGYSVRSSDGLTVVYRSAQAGCGGSHHPAEKCA